MKENIHSNAYTKKWSKIKNKKQKYYIINIYDDKNSFITHYLSFVIDRSI